MVRWQMKIAVTGGAGHLGSTVCGMLEKDGNYDLIAVDIKEVTGISGEARKADLSVKEEALFALKGADIVIHCASVHPFYKYTDTQYLDLNIKGTWNVYSAVKELGIQKVIMTSSIVASGLVFPVEMWPVTEDVQEKPGDIYAYTKYCQEVAAEYFARVHNIQTLALRPCSFMEREPVRQAVSLLGNHMYVRDIASAHIAALKADIPSKFEAFFTTNSLPYSARDKDVAGDLWLLAERYYPGVREWFTERGHKGFYLGTVYSIEKAKRMLGWEPVYNFEWAWAKAKKNG